MGGNMSKVRIAINGFGRIGRVVARQLQGNENVELVAVNDLAPLDQLVNLLKYDSVHRKFQGEVIAKNNCIEINDQIVYVYNCKNPEELPWGDLKIDVVVECTGVFRTKELASKHITAGAKKVVISAPSSDSIPTYVLGINDDLIDAEASVVSNASCTTNCSAPMVKIIDELCEIERGFLTTVHAYTSDQNLHDSPHDKDMRRARAAAENIVPTSTGAANALVTLFPHLHGKLHGSAIRVPVIDGSLTEMTFQVKNPVPISEINKVFKEKSQNEFKGILEYTSDPIVSVDIIGNRHSCIFDSELTVSNGNLIRVVGWYDNETGYSNRLIDLVQKLG
ncbi:MAG: glyceraldehyde 3-phosphate dehydrogenase [Parvicellaceae bacterium]|jgi:glyceraldehyde 3-phosphate dehydrogenase